MVKDSVIYIEIDTLLDTRIGTLTKLNPDWAAKLVKTDFRSRISDDFDKFVPEIDNQLYKQAYANRDWQSLALASPTEFSNDLVRVLDELMYNPTRLVKGGTVQIHVNTYPYNLTDEEKKELIVTLHQVLQTVFFIRIVDFPTSAITLEFMKSENYIMMYVYDLSNALKNVMTEKAIKGKTRCTDTLIFAPQLTFDYEALKQTIEESEREGKKFDPFMHTALIFSPFFTLEFVGSGYFSLVDIEKELNQEKLLSDDENANIDSILGEYPI